MDLKTLGDTPPWDWPANAGATFLRVLRDGEAAEPDRLLAAELAGDMVVINDEIALALLAIASDGSESGPLRGQAAIALGPILEHSETHGFEDSDDVPITEATFNTVQESLRLTFTDTGVAKDVRRRVLEASVRASQNWHRDAVHAGYRSDDEDWKLTAVFCMSYVPGFDKQILEALESKNPDILYAAVCAAGDRGVDAAWPRVAAIVKTNEVDKDLLLAAIGAVAAIRPERARDVLGDHVDSDDEEVQEAALEALALAEGPPDEDDFDDEDDFGLDEVSDEEVPLDQRGKIQDAAASENAGIPPKPGRKVGRNEPCPCGSGKKFKKCCGR